MRKVILSADSTCDLGKELGDKYDVHYCPLRIVLDGEEYIDNVTITPAEIFKAYRKKGILPATSAINIGEYLEYFKPFVDAGYDVIHINLGSGISSSHQNCLAAAAQFDGHVYPVDSCNLSSGSGHLVIAAAEMIEKGMEASQIAEEVKKLVHNCKSSFILDTLEFMKAGGRCSAVTAFGASMLHLKPCIEVDTAHRSKMVVGKKYRGKFDRVAMKYIDDKLEEFPNVKTDRVFLPNTVFDDEFKKEIYDYIAAKGIFKEIIFADASCTISCHCGPGTLGLMIMTEDQ